MSYFFSTITCESRKYYVQQQHTRIDDIRVLAEYDECDTGEHGCDHECVNTLGSFKCECKIGYELHSDGKKCEGEWNERVGVGRGLRKVNIEELLRTKAFTAVWTALQVHVVVVVIECHNTKMK